MLKTTKMSKHILIALFVLVSTQAFSQKTELKEIVFKTSAQCDECKERIEKALSFEKGIKKAEVNLQNFAVTVTYNPEKTTPQKIKEAISKSGYDADDVKADGKSYEALPGCCKKDGHKK